MAKKNFLYDSKYFALLTPIFLQLLFQSFMNSIDVFMVSNFSDEVVASIGVVNKFFIVVNELFMVFSVGTTIILPQFIGARKKEEEKVIVSTSVVISFILGIICSICIWLFSSIIVKNLAISNSQIPDAVNYLKIIAVSYLAQPIVLILNSVLRCYNLSKYVLLVSVFSNLINVVGDYLVIFRPVEIPLHGVSGVAMTTLLGHFFSAIVLLSIYITKVQSLIFSKIKFSIIFKIIKIGVPSIMESLSYTSSQFFIMMIISQFGSAYVSAQIYAMNIMYLVSRLPLAIGILSGIEIGKLVGDNNYESAYDRAISNIRLSLLSLSIIGVLTLILSQKLLTLFTGDVNIIFLAQIVMVFEFITLFAKSVNFIIGDSLRGSGDVFFLL